MMGPNRLVKLGVSRCGPQEQDLRLTYIGPADWAASLQHSHYHHIPPSRRRGVISDKDSIIFKGYYASGVKLDGIYYTIEFAPERDDKAGQLIEVLQLPEIRLVVMQNGARAVKFRGIFDRGTWNRGVSSLKTAKSSKQPQSWGEVFDHKHGGKFLRRDSEPDFQQEQRREFLGREPDREQGRRHVGRESNNGQGGEFMRRKSEPDLQQEQRRKFLRRESDSEQGRESLGSESDNEQGRENPQKKKKKRRFLMGLCCFW
ncbi:hypothetical protein BJ166DRAFT_155153 [Pestalotiopsis sp. NC0098]|nr:hypothetical protein BJ166DRAFT_155153 [Pestalotiopsis sp. NC0098]